ncbi:amidase [Rhodococcus zopfii]|uniref:Amidase n=1 Tax=Rhodococcus zopfii TaxID=43772 RepID=A0ABU3WQF2_9NOCA|nr:amidase [Rhodococcus zopfii]
MQPYELTIQEAAQHMADGSLTAVELTESSLDRIGEVEPALNAFVTVTGEAALRQAEEVDTARRAGVPLGPLAGIPIGVKDLYDMAGIPTTSSSRVRADYIPDRDSAVVDKLRRARSVLVGKTHTHEFAYGGITPTTRNPWNTGHVPAGSSGGSAAAVAAGECMAGLGSDTGGSIRMPAAACGVFGIKPTYGLVSRRGVTSLSWSLDHLGPLTRTALDAAYVLDAMAGYDSGDRASADRPPVHYADGVIGAAGGDVDLRIGIPQNYFTDRVQPEVQEAVERAVEELVGLGATTVPVEIPFADEFAAVSRLIVGAEAASYHRTMLRDRADLYTDQVRTSLETGSLVMATDYIDALRIRALIQDAWKVMFDGVDCLAAPVSPIVAPPVELGPIEWPDGTVEESARAIGRFSAPANQLGLPAVAVPVGIADGLPIGMQLIGRPFSELPLLCAAAAYESLSPVRRPIDVCVH